MKVIIELKENEIKCLKEEKIKTRYGIKTISYPYFISSQQLQLLSNIFKK